MNTSNTSCSLTTSNASLIPRVLSFDEWSKKREGPPPVLPPICASNAVIAKNSGKNYSEAFGNDQRSLTCMVTLSYLKKRGNSEIQTCGLPSGEELRQLDQSEEGAPKKAKRAALKVEQAQDRKDHEAEKTAMAELRQIVDRIMGACFQA